MTLKTAIFDALKSLVPGQRVYPDRFPQVDKPVWPAIRITIVGGTVYEDLCSDGDDESDDVRVQLDWVGKTEAERDALTPLIREAMRTVDPPCRLQGPPIEMFDEETRSYRATADWMAHPSTT